LTISLLLYKPVAITFEGIASNTKPVAFKISDIGLDVGLEVDDNVRLNVGDDNGLEEGGVRN
jgi:hypothetical protein